MHTSDKIIDFGTRHILELSEFVVGIFYFYRPQGEGNVFTGVCPQSASWLFVHCAAFLRRSRHPSYWNAFLYFKYLIGVNRKKTVFGISWFTLTLKSQA